jgi:hypothetical protein
VNTLCQGEDGLQQQAVFHAYHNLVLPHSRCCFPSPARAWAQPSSGGHARQRWQRG